jgi:glycosyltransferase involved in cell wall biosynthesis
LTKYSIVIECQNLVNQSGTGIATYARNLASEVTKLGHRASGLVGLHSKPVSNNTILNEVLFHDSANANEKRRSPALKLQLATAWLHGNPFGARAHRIESSSVVIDNNQSTVGKDMRDIYGVHQLPHRARFHFMRYGSFLNVKGLDGINLLHTTHPVALKAKGTPLICTIHDLIPLRLPQTTLDNKKYFYDLIKEVTRQCDRIATVSEHSKRDIMSIFNVPEERVINTYQSVEVSPEIVSMDESELAQQLESQFGLGLGDYFLFAGAVEPKKNISRIIDAHAASGSNRPLIIAGRLGWQFEGDVERMKDERFRTFKIEGNTIRAVQSVRHLNYVPRQSLLMLMRGARALVFPSLYEGFGLPVLEAMALGTPVITSCTSSLPEVSGDAALMVDPYDVGAISSAIRTLDADHDLCQDLGKRGVKQAELFSSENYRKRLTELYKGVI